MVQSVSEGHMGKPKSSENLLPLMIESSRTGQPEWAARMDEILHAVTGNQGQLILLIGTNEKMIRPSGGFSAGSFNTETCFGLGRLSSGDPTDISFSETGHLVFPTDKRSCVVHDREDRMRVARDDFRSALVHEDLSTGFNYRLIVPLSEINSSVGYHGPSRRLLEVFCGTSAVEALFEPGGAWARYREKFEYMCQVLGHETAFTRKAKEEAHAKAVRNLDDRRKSIGPEIRAVYEKAQELGVADTPDYRALRNVLEQLGFDGGLD